MPNSTPPHQLYEIALTLLPGVGDVLAKNLVAYCGSAQAIFSTSKSRLEKIPGIGKEKAAQITSTEVLKEAEEELKFIDKYQIETLFFTDKKYPYRLKECTDSPVMMYYRGNTDLNSEKIIAVVGTRRITNYGKEQTQKLIADLAAQNIVVVSGLAYGVDVCAHQAALENSLPTVGVLGHGLNTVYPQAHKSVAKKMIAQGGLLTEYRSSNKMHPSNFPSRNRIVAGLCDALVVVESAVEGGAMLTANVANSYNREVFAFPGKTSDRFSAGCNFLIKTYKAKMIESAEDLLREMNWQSHVSANENKKKQRQLAIALNDEEQKIYRLLQEKEGLVIDELAEKATMNISTLAATLLEMEMNNILISLPGKRYKLV